MAITKITLGNDPETVREFLDGTGLFDSVTRSGGTITCKDSDDNSVLVIAATNITTWQFTVALAGSNTWSKTYTNNSITYGCKCENGAFLVLTTGSATNTYSVVITRNNAGKVTFVFPYDFTERHKYTCLTFDDMAGAQPRAMMTPTADDQTQLVTFLTHAGMGATSYTPNAFYNLFTDMATNKVARFVMDGKVYLTDGYYTLLDGDL